MPACLENKFFSWVLDRSLKIQPVLWVFRENCVDEGCQLTSPERQLFQGDVFLSGEKHPGFILLWEEVIFMCAAQIWLFLVSFAPLGLLMIPTLCLLSKWLFPFSTWFRVTFSKYQPDESLDMLSWLLGIADLWIRTSLEAGINNWISELDTPWSDSWRMISQVWRIFQGRGSDQQRQILLIDQGRWVLRTRWQHGGCWWPRWAVLALVVGRKPDRNGAIGEEESEMTDL